MARRCNQSILAGINATDCGSIASAASGSLLGAPMGATPASAVMDSASGSLLVALIWDRDRPERLFLKATGPPAALLSFFFPPPPHLTPYQNNEELCLQPVGERPVAHAAVGGSRRSQCSWPRPQEELGAPKLEWVQIRLQVFPGRRLLAQNTRVAGIEQNGRR